MSICARIFVFISFHHVDAAPHTEAGTQGNHQGLKGRNCGLKKCHIVFAGTEYRSKPEEKRRVLLRQLLFQNCAALSGVCVRCQGVGCRENYKSAAEAAPLAGVLCKDFRLQEEPKGDQPHGQPGGQVWHQEQCQRQEQHCQQQRQQDEL